MADTKIMSKRRFPSYKSYLQSHVEKKRKKGKDWKYLTVFITNFVAHDCKYALTGKQMKELLELAR